MTMINIKKEIKMNYIIFIAIFLSGTAALMYEVIASETLFFYFNQSSYSVATVLTSFLFGLALGSLLMAKFIYKVKDKKKLFIIFQILLALYAFFILTKFEYIQVYLFNFYKISDNFLLSNLIKFGISFLYLIIPTLILGALFPLASSLIVKRAKKAGTDVGLLYSFDTFGAILGAFLAGFILIPLLGLKLSIFTGGIFNLMSGFLILDKERKKIIKYALLSSVVILLFLLPFTSAKTNPKTYEGKEVIFSKMSPYGLVEILDSKFGEELFIDKKGQCGTYSHYDQKIADLTLNQFERDIKVLHIGLGCGGTLKGILNNKNVKEVDVVEINPLIPKINELFFSEYNKNVLEDERVNLVVEDGASFLARAKNKYDAVIITVNSPEVAHSSSLYTIEYFRIISDALNKDGILSVYGFDHSYDYKKILYFSLKEGFPYVYFKDTSYLMIFGSKREIDLRLDLDEAKTLDRLEKETDYQLNSLNHKILQNYIT